MKTENLSGVRPLECLDNGPALARAHPSLRSAVSEARWKVPGRIPSRSTAYPDHRYGRLRSSILAIRADYQIPLSFLIFLSTDYRVGHRAPSKRLRSQAQTRLSVRPSFRSAGTMNNLGKQDHLRKFQREAGA